MKTISMIFMTMLFNTLLFANEPVPAAVADAFHANYPGVKAVNWEHRAGQYVAMFKQDEGLTKVFYDGKGTWLETRVRLQLNELPGGVQHFIAKYYVDADVNFAGKVMTPNGALYRIESELPDAVVVKILNEDGELIKEERISFSLGVQLPEHEPFIIEAIKSRPWNTLYSESSSY